MEVSQNPEVAFLDDPVMLLLSTDPQESKLTLKRYLHINVFEALFIIVSRGTKLGIHQQRHGERKCGPMEHFQALIKKFLCLLESVLG